MIVKIFKTIGLRTYLISTILIFFGVFFSSLSGEDGVNWPSDQWLEILGNIGIIILSIMLITRQEIKIKGRKFDGIHFIAFPITFLFFPFLFKVDIIPVTILVLLIYGHFTFIQSLHSKNSEKWILDLSLIISITVQFNMVFAIFYLLPVTVLFVKGFKGKKHLMALLLPVLLIPFIFRALINVFPTMTSDLTDSPAPLDILSIQSLSIEERVWFTMLIISVLICLFRLPRGSRKFSFPELYSGFLFMTFWLFFSIVYEILGLQVTEGPWFFSYIPVAYFFGVFLENISSDFMKNTLLTFLFFGIIIFKLFSYGIIAVELPFSN